MSDETTTLQDELARLLEALPPLQQARREARAAHDTVAIRVGEIERELDRRARMLQAETP